MIMKDKPFRRFIFFYLFSNFFSFIFLITEKRKSKGENNYNYLRRNNKNNGEVKK